MSCSYYAATHKDTEAFMAELLALFRRHGMAIVPTYGGEVSFHDPMEIVPLDPETKAYVKDRTGYRPGLNESAESAK